MLLRTSKDNKHYHIVYVKENGGVTSVNKDHSHQISFVFGKPVIVMADDGHTHQIEELKIEKEDKDKRDDNVVVSEVRALFKEAKEEEKDFRKKANEFLKFRYG